MQVTLNPSTPAEVRLLAAFMQDLADHMENTSPVVLATAAPEPQTEVVQEEKPKRSRKAKEEPAAAATPTEPETQSATTAEAPTESGSSEAAPVEVPAGLDHDKLRTLFGELANAGKRQEGINAVTELGFKSIKDIPSEKLADAWKAMQAVLA